MTVEEVFLKWREKKSKFIRESSLAVYDNAYINHISPYIGDMDVCAVNKKKTVELMLKLRAKGLSIKYCGDVKIVLKMIVDFAGNDLDLDVKNTHWTMEWPQYFMLSTTSLITGLSKILEDKIVSNASISSEDTGSKIAP